MITEYELYSDERTVSASNKHRLFLGGVICTETGRVRLLELLSEVRGRGSLSAEMKWQKVSRGYVDRYREWVDVFFDDPFARFSLLEIDISSAAWNAFRPRPDREPSRDDRLASAFHQFLLVTFGRLRDTKRWWVYPDAGLFSREKVLARVEHVFNRTYKRAFGPKSSRVIRLARSRDSARADLVQLSDVLLGAFSWSVIGGVPDSTAKAALVAHCSGRLAERPTTRSGVPTLSSYRWVPPDQFHYGASKDEAP